MPLSCVPAGTPDRPPRGLDERLFIASLTPGRALARKYRDRALVVPATDDDHCDIVLRTALKCQPYERLASFLRRKPRNALKDLAVMHVSGKTVAAQNERIAGVNYTVHGVKPRILEYSNTPGNDIS